MSKDGGYPGRKNNAWGDSNHRSGGYRGRPGGNSDRPGGSRDRPAGFRGSPRDVPPGPPKLIPCIYFPQEENSLNAPHAKIVFLGNLHPDLKQCHIYDLCNSAKSPPLHVAMRVRIHSYGLKLHSAHVYVRSEEDVKNLVLSLDNLIINGYKMIACPIEKMIEEGRALSNQNRK